MINLLLKNTYFFSVLIFLTALISCKPQIKEKQAFLNTEIPITQKEIIVGANQTARYLPLLEGKRIGIVANQTSVIFKSDSSYTHLVDSLLQLKVDVTTVFSLEHGFRGDADAGEQVNDDKDAKTGLPIISLHGKEKRKPSKEHLKDIDIMIFDVQDVGVRFYTYISSLHYIMEACAEANIPLILLDRPNPNGHYVDGPTLEMEHKSFVGMHPIPLVYGMTIGEYGHMINGQDWLKNKVKCDLTVIPLQNYTHQSAYSLPIRPSPNLPNDVSINLYPSLGFFEGTTINAGRGTEMQFQIYGAPFFPKSDFTYTPEPNFGSKSPKHKGEICNGVDLRNEERLSEVNLKWLIDIYKKTPKGTPFFGPTFTIHAGNTTLQQQLEKGLTQEQIKETWQEDLEAFKKIRSNYLIYNE
tara:strand:+ start:50720 stop:51955 length:1236 start_codon:yes stop_codon:yes gene_type:complete